MFKYEALFAAYWIVNAVSPKAGRRLFERFRRSLYRKLSTIANERADSDAIVFINCGYAELEGDGHSVELPAEASRFPTQMYHKVASGAPLEGKDVLEVGCGRGGGASFVVRHHKPASYLGVDLCPEAIEFDQRFHQVPGLSFQEGDAEALPCADASFDVVLNVESSHCYVAIDRFFAEVARVLRPGGHLLFADIRSAANWPVLRQVIAESPLELVHDERITDQVVRALDLDHEEKVKLMEEIRPSLSPRLRTFVDSFAGLKGSTSYEQYLTGERDYYFFVLKCDGLPPVPKATLSQRNGG